MLQKDWPDINQQNGLDNKETDIKVVLMGGGGVHVGYPLG
jgi:hypothetical protein